MLFPTVFTQKRLRSEDKRQYTYAIIFFAICSSPVAVVSLASQGSICGAELENLLIAKIPMWGKTNFGELVSISSKNCNKKKISRSHPSLSKNNLSIHLDERSADFSSQETRGWKWEWAQKCGSFTSEDSTGISFFPSYGGTITAN